MIHIKELQIKFSLMGYVSLVKVKSNGKYNMVSIKYQMV